MIHQLVGENPNGFDGIDRGKKRAATRAPGRRDGGGADRIVDVLEHRGARVTTVRLADQPDDLTLPVGEHIVSTGKPAADEVGAGLGSR